MNRRWSERYWRQLSRRERRKLRRSPTDMAAHSAWVDGPVARLGAAFARAYAPMREAVFRVGISVSGCSIGWTYPARKLAQWVQVDA